MTFYTYLWLREDGTPYYVGKGQKYRIYEPHRVGPAPSSNRIIVQEHPSEEDAIAAEIFLIAYFGRKDLGVGVLRNLTDGGEGTSNPSQATRLLRSQKLKGKKRPDNLLRWTDQHHSMATRRKISATLSGHQQTLEHRRKVSQSMTGRTLSAETRRRMSVAQKQRFTQQGGACL